MLRVMREMPCVMCYVHGLPHVLCVTWYVLYFLCLGIWSTVEFSMCCAVFRVMRSVVCVTGCTARCILGVEHIMHSGVYIMHCVQCVA